MDNWIIGARLVVLLYCISRYTRGDMSDIPIIVLLALAYVCICMLAHIFKSTILKRCFLVSSIAILAVSAVTVNQLFILLLTPDILELVSSFTGNKKIWLLSIVLPAFLCSGDIIADYALVSLLCSLVFLLAAIQFESITSLKKTNEHLRTRNSELSSKLNTGCEYEAQVRYLSQLEERNSLAQKIHDRVGHTIAGSIIQLEAAGMIICRDKDKAAEIIAAVTANLKEGMDSIRLTLRNIKPPQEQLGINRLKLMVEEFSVKNSIKAALQYKNNLEHITHSQWGVIMDNTREALTNTLKYSSATQVVVKIEVMNKIIKVEVRDNGKGALSWKKGMGLTGMEERTESAGGKLILDGSNGFSVITLLPSGEVLNADKSANSR